MPIIHKITSWNQITPFGNYLYTNGREVRVVKHIGCSSPSKVQPSTRLDWQGERHWKGEAPYGVAPTTAKAFRSWVNSKKKMSQVVYANALDGAEGLMVESPLECHWDGSKGLWVHHHEGTCAQVTTLGLVRCDGIYTFVAEREAEVQAWMLGARAALRAMKSYIDNKNRWGKPLHAHQ